MTLGGGVGRSGLALAVSFLAGWSQAAQAQEPNTLVTISLLGTGHAVTVEGVLLADSTLLLPARDVAAFLGLGTPVESWVTPAILAARFPTVRFAWEPRGLTLAVDDPLQVLAATRAFSAAIARQAQGAPGLTVTRGGPFLAVSGDDQRHSLLDIGYSWRGRVAVTARRSSAAGEAWSLSLAPLPALFFATTGGQRQPLQIQGRIAAGPVWLAPTYTGATERLGADGLVALGPVALFASTRHVLVFSIKGPGGDLQLGRSAGVTAARLSWGPVPASPFAFPQVR